MLLRKPTKALNATAKPNLGNVTGSPTTNHYSKPTMTFTEEDLQALDKTAISWVSRLVREYARLYSDGYRISMNRPLTGLPPLPLPFIDGDSLGDLIYDHFLAKSRREQKPMTELAQALVSSGKIWAIKIGKFLEDSTHA